MGHEIHHIFELGHMPSISVSDGFHNIMPELSKLPTDQHLNYVRLSLLRTPETQYIARTDVSVA